MPAGRKKAGFDALKMRVEREARSALRKARPLYVAEFDSVLRATNGDFQRATKHAARYLHKPLQIWPEVLTALFDVEYVRIKVSDAFSLLDKATPEASDAGFWFRYHLDHWTFQMDAFLDRSDRFFRKFIRALVRPSRPQEWQAIERDLAKKVGGAQAEIANIRNPLAHGLGDGVSALLTEWEPVLAAPFPMMDSDDFVRGASRGGFTATDEARRKRWLKSIRRASVLTFAYIEAFSDELLAELPPERA